MGVKTNRTSSLSGNRSVQHGTKKKKKKKKKNAKTCYLTNTNLTNTWRSQFHFSCIAHHMLSQCEKRRDTI